MYDSFEVSNLIKFRLLKKTALFRKIHKHRDYYKLNRTDALIIIFLKLILLLKSQGYQRPFVYPSFQPHHQYHQ